MSKNKRIPMMLAKGGVSQSDIASALHVSKRDVSRAAKAIKEYGLTFDTLSSVDVSAIDDLFFTEPHKLNEAYLQPNMEAFVERKKKNHKIPVKLFWIEYCESALATGKLAYAYQTFCEMFSACAEKMDATRHFAHEPAAKCYIDWAGDVAYIYDKLLGTKTKVYVLVVVLPFSDKFWAEGFCDMKQKSWQEGHMHAFEDFGGVPRMWVPDNAATATNRTSAARITLLNKEYTRFAEHYGAAIVPARVRKPKDKSVAESAVDLVERWIIGPANEMKFYTIEEFNEFCTERVAWLNARPFSAKDGSRDSVFEEEERMHLMELPQEHYEMCEWRCAKVAPDYHVPVDYMHYSVCHSLIGKQVDIKLTSSLVTVLLSGGVVACHTRRYGRKGQYSTIVEHMPNTMQLLVTRGRQIGLFLGQDESILRRKLQLCALWIAVQLLSSHLCLAETY